VRYTPPYGGKKKKSKSSFISLPQQEDIGMLSWDDDDSGGAGVQGDQLTMHQMECGEVKFVACNGRACTMQLIGLSASLELKVPTLFPTNSIFFLFLSFVIIIFNAHFIFAGITRIQ
jgi:hypothetical protein